MQTRTFPRCPTGAGGPADRGRSPRRERHRPKPRWYCRERRNSTATSTRCNIRTLPESDSPYIAARAQKHDRMPDGRSDRGPEDGGLSGGNPGIRDWMFCPPPDQGGYQALMRPWQRSSRRRSPAIPRCRRSSVIWTRCSPGLRQRVRDMLSGRDDLVVDDAILVADELVTNALRHGQAPCRCRLTLTEQGRRLRIEVDDAASTQPQTRTPDQHGGRGLALVDLLAASWEVQRCAPHKTAGSSVGRPTCSCRSVPPVGHPGGGARDDACRARHTIVGQPSPTKTDVVRI